MWHADNLGGVAIGREQAITARTWPAGERPKVIALSAIKAALDSKTVVWIDVVPVNDPIDIGRRLEPHLPGLTRDMLPALINPPLTAQTLGGLRLVRWTAADAPQETPTAPPALLVASLNILCGSGWVMTFRGAGWEAAGGGGGERLEPQDLIDFVAGADWQRIDQRAEDLATLWLRACAQTMSTAATRLTRYLHNGDLARWEGLHDAPTRQTLRGLAFRVDTLAIGARNLQQPGLPSATAWFAPAVDTGAAQAIADLLHETTISLDNTRRDLRAVIDQLDLEQAEADREQRRQRDLHEQRRSERSAVVVGTLASCFLAPALLATLFGAFPTWFAWDRGQRAQALAVASVALVVITLAALWATQLPPAPDAPDAGDGDAARARPLPPFDRHKVLVGGAVAALAFAIGTAWLVSMNDDPPASAPHRLAGPDRTARQIIRLQRRNRGLVVRVDRLEKRLDRLQRARSCPAARPRC